MGTRADIMDPVDLGQAGPTTWIPKKQKQTMDKTTTSSRLSTYQFG
jgi:hypothetical protein